MLKASKLELKTIVYQKPGFIVSDMDGEKVMMSVENGKYYSLGHIGGEIWGMISQPVSIAEIIENLILLYDVNFSECEEHVACFLLSLHEERLIFLKD